MKIQEISMKKVAVITRTKDRPIMLPRVLISLKRQTFNDFTWVLVNDSGEKEPVDNIAKKGKEAGLNVKVVHREQSIGMEAASNDGIARSESEYIVIHDDDDTWEAEFLEKTTRYLDENKEVVGVITWTNKINEFVDSNKTKFLGVEPYNHWLKAVYLAEVAIVNQFPPISFLFRRSIYDKVGGFDESLPVLGDWDFNLKVLIEGDIHVVPYVLANYHFRVNVNQETIAYGNSLTSGINKHILYDAIYRNRRLREDIKNGQLGIGVFLGYGQMLKKLNEGNFLLNHVLYKLKEASQKNKLLLMIRKMFKL